MIDPMLERDEKLRHVVDRLIAAYQPERIYLFGSMARREAGAKRTAAAANPLAPRAVTNPMPSRDTLPGPFAPPAQQAAQQQVQPAPQPPPRVTRPAPPRDDWARGVLGR